MPNENIIDRLNDDLQASQSSLEFWRQQEAEQKGTNLETALSAVVTNFEVHSGQLRAAVEVFREHSLG